MTLLSLLSSHLSCSKRLNVREGCVPCRYWDADLKCSSTRKRVYKFSSTLQLPLYNGTSRVTGYAHTSPLTASFFCNTL